MVPVKPGVYTVRWSSKNLSSYRSTKLEYSLHWESEELVSRSDKDSGLDMHSLSESLEEDVFYDAVEYL